MAAQRRFTPDFKAHVVLKDRWNLTADVNYKYRYEVLALFKLSEKLQAGSFSHAIRENEGPTDQSISVGRKLPVPAGQKQTP